MRFYIKGRNLVSEFLSVIFGSKYVEEKIIDNRFPFLDFFFKALIKSPLQ
ncbi:unknown protein [Simkania negevensis Z]|uniref:Uncharacterized protein n=1 Tax=Simkania negevensis (strain ATCC VR-1471 / DSM 27360 / Z) TaxID=331113 RepID=F8L728_SIMNZ|nr:unknown protein [Simkania negevensis Z]